MTGNGANDAPALKAALIGIAMGERGTDVAREAANLVLLDDDFSSIAQAVKLAKRIFDNIRKAMAYTIATHVPLAAMSLLPVMLRWPLVLLPMHIVFLELIIDPPCSIVFEAEQEEASTHWEGGLTLHYLFMEPLLRWESDRDFLQVGECF